MQNFKKGLTSDEVWSFWEEPAVVTIKGDPAAAKVHPDINDKEAQEKIIQSWNKIVVLRATSDKPVKFWAGFYDMGLMLYLKHDFETGSLFAMRNGPYDLKIFALSKDLVSKIKLEIVEFTTENDPKYKDVLLI